MGFKTWADYNETDYALERLQKLREDFEDFVNPKEKYDITKEEGYDAETKTTKKMRIAAYKKYGEPICRNIVGEEVFIGGFPEIEELMTADIYELFEFERET